MFIEVTRHINASPEQVWAVIADIERWPDWTTSMTSVNALDEGPLHTGSRAKVKQPRSPAIVWTVSSVDPGKAFAWEAAVFGGKIVASHYVAASPDGGTSLRLVVEARGGLTGILSGWLERTSRKNMALEADGAKRQSEGLAALVA